MFHNFADNDVLHTFRTSFSRRTSHKLHSGDQICYLTVNALLIMRMSDEVNHHPN